MAAASSLAETTTTYKDVENWDDLECDIELLRGIYAYGFEKPSPIQRRAIRPMFMGRDIIAQAQSGTGKTGCFVISPYTKKPSRLPG